MKTSTTTSIRLIAALLAATGMNAEAITITTDSFTDFNMDFAEVGDPGNTGVTYTDFFSNAVTHGAVSYTYRMGVNEVSEQMIDDYNTYSGGPTITKDTRGADKPATSVTWNEAARFVNWLNTSQGYQAAYLFETTGANDNISLWTSAEAWQLDGENLYRHKDAKYFLPSEDEWYKAAYYDGTTYYSFATGSNTVPTRVANGTTAGTAVFNEPGGPADIDDAGGLSPYGTMAQSGNVWEWAESAFDGGNDTTNEVRAVRGGDSANLSFQMQSNFRNAFQPAVVDSLRGFRVASFEFEVVPEPSSTALLGLGGLALMLRRRR